MTTAQKIARIQKSSDRREYEQTLIIQAGGGYLNSNFLSSLHHQSQTLKRYLSVKQMAVVERMINEQEAK